MAFDIRTALSGRSFPTATVSIWTDEEVFFRINALEKRLAGETDHGKVAELEDALSGEYKRRDAEAIEVTIQAITPRSREDLTTKAFSEFPIKRDPYGREDELQAFKRNRHLKELIFAKYIKVLKAADGEQVLDDETAGDVVRAILDQAPEFSIERLDKAIEQLSIKADAERIASMEPDFLSKS